MKLQEICNRLRSCKYECEGGYLENNIAFVELETIAQLEADTHAILGMTREEMARLWRFAPVGHPYFDRNNPASDIFEMCFKELGGFCPAVSKIVGLERTP